MPSGRAYADYMNRLNRILGTMLGAEIDFIVKGIDSTTHSAVASRRDAMLRKRQTFYLRQRRIRKSLHLSRPSGRGARDRRRGEGAARRSLWH